MCTIYTPPVIIHMWAKQMQQSAVSWWRNVLELLDLHNPTMQRGARVVGNALSKRRGLCASVPRTPPNYTKTPFYFFSQKKKEPGNLRSRVDVIVKFQTTMYNSGNQDESTPLLANPASTPGGRPRIRFNRAREASAPLRFSPAFAPARVHANAAPTASENQYPLINTRRCG